MELIGEQAVKQETLPKSYEAKPTEQKWRDIWKTNNWAKAQAKKGAPSYSIIMPPPNVTGKLHIGHALGQTVQDILIRFKRMSGFDTLWVPGTDHAGIATQSVVERNLMQKEGKRRVDMQRDEFLTHCWNWKNDCESTIIDQIQLLGGSCDWSRYAFTMDEPRSKAVATAFKKLFDKGLIYRGDYLVNWDPVTQTALADDEVEYEERQGSLWHIEYKTDQGDSIIIATTRPETFLGDVAVAVHPEDERYRALIGQYVTLPLIKRKVPILADSFVDPSFGTGAVKITPAHDHNDYQMALRHQLEMINIMNPDATLNENAGSYKGLRVDQARQKVVEDLKAGGHLVKVDPHTLRVGLSYRSKAVIEPMLSKQWFVKLSAFKKQLREAVESKRVELVPQVWENTYYHWIDNLRDWCISRQLWWGHRIPVWYNKNDDRILCHDGAGLPPEAQQDPDSWHQDEDVLDTWFSSALWPMTTMGWPEKTEDMQRYFPNSMLVTGHDILFFWVARMILMSELMTGEIPFHKVYLTGLVFAKSYWRQPPGSSVVYVSKEERDAFDLGAPIPKDVHWRWEKMSKSKGNVIDPIEMMETYGADALRLALATSLGDSRQIDLDRRRFEEYKNFSNKLFNGVRFALMNLDQEPILSNGDFCKGISKELLNLEDHWILARYQETIEGVNHELESCNFAAAIHRAYSFFWDDFCAYYVEISKPILWSKTGTAQERSLKLQMLILLISGSLRLLHPAAPFITEELFSALKSRMNHLKAGSSTDAMTNEAIEAFQSPSCMASPFPRAFLKADESRVEAFCLVKEILYKVRQLRGDMKIPPGQATDLHLVMSSTKQDQVEKGLHILQALLPLKQIVWQMPDQSSSLCSHSSLEGVDIYVPLPKELAEIERTRLKKNLEQLESNITLLETRLANPEFKTKAPAELIAKQSAQLDAMKEQKTQLEKQISQL